MATEARKFRVGLFVIAAIVIGVSAAIWLGASRYLADESLAVTYFSESVQGLDPGAAVKYRGVPAGRVERIGIAPDGDLIQVTMSINRKYDDLLFKDPSLRAQLQLSGITGLRYVEIDRHSGDALLNAPTLSFTPDYPLIPSTPSQFKAIQEALEAGEFNRVPLILGTNRDERRIYMYRLPRWQEVLRKSPDDYTKYANYPSLQWKYTGVDSLARAMSPHQPAIYAYRFDWDESGRIGDLDLSVAIGASHSTEIAFVFGDWSIGFLPPAAMYPEELTETVGCRLRITLPEGIPAISNQ